MQTLCLFLSLFITSALGLSDFEALLELKKGIEKDPSGQMLGSWDSKSLSSDKCPQNWYGITCIDGHVMSIGLNDLGLVGTFSFPVIFELRMLQNLSVSNNHLTGTISKIGSLQSLVYLDLSRNMFHGLVPSGIANLRSLMLLNLSSNNFEGMAPFGFGNLERLKYLDLQGNELSGDVMHLFSQLGSLTYVDISMNSFSGSLDLALGKPSFVSSIQYLNVSHNALVGQLFAHDGMPFFDSLEVFDASDNQFVGSVPSFSFIVSLRILRLGGNKLSGSLPEALLQESSTILSELDLSLNQLEGPVGSITSATLKKLNLSSNRLSGSLPLMVGHCAIIDLSNNRLSGNLSRIQSWGNYVEAIRLSSNSLAGTLPNQTSQFLRLISLQVANNSLQGVLPLVLGTYPELKVADLSHNQLSGFLPENLFGSAKLTDLNLSSNNFTGSLPLQHVGGPGNLSLATLDLSHNSLSGVLPEELSGFHNLVFLDLSDNKFEGSIPNGLPDKLKGFNVSSNNLSGDVPTNLRRFPDSAFHPGNSLLMSSGSPSTPKDASDLTLRDHRSHLKPARKAAIIVGLVGAAALVASMCMLIYYTFHKHRRKEVSDGNEEKKSSQQGESPGPQTPSPRKNADPSVSPTAVGGVTCGVGNTSSVVKASKELGHPKSIRRDEILSSPMSLLSSSTPSPSKSQHSPEYLGGLKSYYTQDKLGGDLHLFDSSLAFTAEELSCAPAEAIGRSCHGTLYRATLESGHVLAVKWLRDGIAKGKKEFVREIKKLGSIKHPNLVSLHAYYWGPKEHEKLIISKYINAPCLTDYLQETDSKRLPPLSLDDRLKIALDMARCLNYLHNEKAIPHGNLKSMNILLEPPHLNARLTDYSLHRILTPAATAEQVLNAGALGYRPPEFASSSKPCPSLKSDVYAFGVILLELMTGKSSGEIVSSDPGVVDLTDWVRLLARKNRAMECFDQSILETNNVHNISRVLHDVLQVALNCIVPASERLDMKSVLEALSSIVSERIV